jgi:hypothetical protein
VIVTRKPPTPPSLPTLILCLLLAALPLLGCSLTDRLANLLPGQQAMSLEEALEIAPQDSRPTLLEEMGPPDAFSITFDELEGQVVRWESWSYFDFNTQFDFIDGELLWSVELEAVPDGSIYAHWYDPLEFQAGMSAAEVKQLLVGQELLEVNLDALDLEGGLALAGDQILLGFQDDQLVYVETLILSPDPEGQPLADLPSQAAQPTPEPTGEPTAEPTVEPTLEPTAPSLIRFEDDFEGETALALPIFTSFMEYGVIDGDGVLTSHYPGGVLGAYYQEPVLADFILEVVVHPLGFVEGSKAGILFRSEQPDAGADYYYMLSIDPTKQQFWFEVWHGGKWAVQQTQPIPKELIPAYGIYQLKVDCQGDNILVYLGGELAAQFQSDLIMDPGYFGLTIVSARDPETVTFDDLVISEQP